MTSFIIIFTSSRIDNLLQTLYFLYKREGKWLDEQEIILICQEEANSMDFPKCKLINLKSNSYNKPIMCNLGVKEAKNPIIALLDSDRILPENYFQRNTKLVTSKLLITTTYLFKLHVTHTSQEIEQNHVIGLADFRSPTFKIFCKNVFSGNTIFLKDDYISAGGMDESFIGYGYDDSDTTLSFLKQGFKVSYLKELELHLWHEVDSILDGKLLSGLDLHTICMKNGVQFFKKWDLKPPIEFIHQLSLHCDTCGPVHMNINIEELLNEVNQI